MVLAFWQLGSGWMLLWGAAALVPILIHLWSRHRFQQMPWGAMQFLLAAMRKNARRIQLTQWLLLALRTLILILFSLALADPLLSLVSAISGAPAGGQTLVVLVLDGSFSMDFRRAGVPRFDDAKDLARQIVEQGRQGDGYTLVLMAEPPRVVIGEPAFDPADVAEELAGLEMPHGGASLPATLAEVEALMRRVQEQHPRLVRRRVIFLTDLGRTTWQEVNSADCRERLARLASQRGTSLALLDLGQPQEQNLAITQLEPAQPLATLASETTFQAEIQSFADQEMPRQSVELLVDGQRVAEQQVDLAARGRASVTFPFQFETPGEHTVEVRLADDQLPLDNRRWLSVPVRESIRVLCIYGRPGESRHLALALEPRQTDRPRIRVDEAAESSILETELTAYDCVMLCNVGRISRDEAGVLHDYMRRGGGLVVFLGDQVQLENYNQELVGEASGKRVLPARLLSLSQEPQYHFDPLDYRHPIVAPFRGFETSGLLTTLVWKYVRLSPHDQATVALGFTGGDPALVEERIDRGMSLMFASAVSPQSVDRGGEVPTPWTALSSWPSFPPLVQEILLRAVSRREEARNVRVGEELFGVASGPTSDATVNLLGPHGRSERLPLVTAGEEMQWSYSGTSHSGIYEAAAAAPGSVAQKYAVNVDPRESDLERFPQEMLPSQISLSLGVADPVQSLATADGGSSYFRLLLWGVLLLLACEALVAWRIGRGVA